MPEKVPFCEIVSFGVIFQLGLLDILNIIAKTQLRLNLGHLDLSVTCEDSAPCCPAWSVAWTRT